MQFKLSISVLLWVVFFFVSFSIAEKKELNNNSLFRKISDKLDSVLDTSYDNPKDSKTRALLHAAYHESQYHLTDNPRERERAKDQWGHGFGGSTDNLKKYDEKHFNK